MIDWKFRGFDAVGQKGWVYGDLTHEKKVLKEAPFLADRVVVGGYEVVPESVGLFTGMTDKNGVEIYDGDVISVSIDEMKYFDASVVWSKRHAAFLLYEGDGCFAPISRELSENNAKVIGNTYEINKNKKRKGF